jgi:hypothetical protein
MQIKLDAHEIVKHLGFTALKSLYDSNFYREQNNICLLPLAKAEFHNLMAEELFTRDKHHNVKYPYTEYL